MPLTLPTLLLAAVTSALPTGFADTVVISGRTHPTSIRFAPDGRIFIAEKSGRIWVYADLDDLAPVQLIDLRPEVMDYWDRGLLGLAIDPQFPARPYLYVLYTYDAPVGGTAPTWNDACADPTGAGCPVSGRLEQITVGPGSVASERKVLIQDQWCQQYPSHSIGDLHFGADGALYVTGGDGASFNFADDGSGHGNPCGDPLKNPDGGVPTFNQGGALRSQDLLAPGDPVGFNGALLRLDPDTGEAFAGNPLAPSGDPAKDRIVAIGMRNPYRFTIRSETNDIWIGDVGYNTWEEINRVPDPLTLPIHDFGWPCYEGNNGTSAKTPGYQGFAFCSSLYAGTAPLDLTGVSVAAPYYAYKHGDVVAGCHAGSSAIAGLVFYESGPYPGRYAGALFFTDYSRQCVWAMLPGAGGLPDPAQVVSFSDPTPAGPVNLEIGPAGDLFYPGFDDGKIHRISYDAPVAQLTATPTSGDAPLTVQFDGSASTGLGTLAYSWDLDGDGAFGDSTDVAPTFVYGPGAHLARLRVTDPQGASSTAQVLIAASNTPPVPTILTPDAALTWKVGQTVTFSGAAMDGQDGALPPEALSWSLLIHHCPAGCHIHALQGWEGVSGASFPAPDHESPSYLELQLTATDSGGLTAQTSITLQPAIRSLHFDTVPSGLLLSVGGIEGPTPFDRVVIDGSTNSLAANSPQSLGGKAYLYDSWSDLAGANHDVVADGGVSSFVATYLLDSNGDGVADVHDNCPAVANPDQHDTVGNHVGDACRPPTPPGAVGGCACGQGSPAPAAPWALLLLLGLVARRRRPT